MINIQDIIPFMKKGWVAMDENGEWFWYETKQHFAVWKNAKRKRKLNKELKQDD